MISGGADWQLIYRRDENPVSVLRYRLGAENSTPRIGKIITSQGQDFFVFRIEKKLTVYYIIDIKISICYRSVIRGAKWGV